MTRSKYWRRPGRRDQERKAFSRLMDRVEKIRLRDGLTKNAVAAEIGTSKVVLCSWVTGSILDAILHHLGEV
jgi:ribosome-binding protein aMBF1 (putative translation factor)